MCDEKGGARGKALEKRSLGVSSQNEAMAVQKKIKK